MDLVPIQRYFAQDFRGLSASERSLKLGKIALEALAVTAVVYLAVINPYVRVFTIGMTGVGIIYQVYQNSKKPSLYTTPRRRLKPPTKKVPRVALQSPSQAAAPVVQQQAPVVAPILNQPAPQASAVASVAQDQAPQAAATPAPEAPLPPIAQQPTSAVSPVAQDQAPQAAVPPVVQQPAPEVPVAPVVQQLAPQPVQQQADQASVPRPNPVAAQAVLPNPQVEEDFISFADFVDLGVQLKLSRSSDMSRSLAMVRRLTHVKEFDSNKMEMTIQNVQHIVITSNTTDFAGFTPLVSCGLNEREMILLNPCSAELEITYRHFCKFFIEAGVVWTKPQVFRRLTACMQQVFLREKYEMTFDFIKRRKTGNGFKINGEPCIPIEDFIYRRHGVCRHHSLVAAYLLARFLQEYPEKWGFEGKVQIIRDNLEGTMKGGHAWISFSSKGGEVFLIDTLNNFMGNLADSVFYSQMVGAFGSMAIENHKKKAIKLS